MATKHLRVNPETDAKLGAMAERLSTSKVWLGEMILSEALRAMEAEVQPTGSNIVNFVREQLGKSVSRVDDVSRRLSRLEERMEVKQEAGDGQG